MSWVITDKRVGPRGMVTVDMKMISYADPQYMRGLKHRLANYKDTLVPDSKSPTQTPLGPGQASVAGSAGGVALTEEATHSESGGPAMDQVDAYETPPSPSHRPSGLPRRKSRLPARYRNVLPPPAPAVIPSTADRFLGHRDARSTGITSGLSPSVVYTSPTNSYGIYRVYKHSAPSYTPDDDFNLDSVADNPNFARTSSGIRTAPSPVLFDTDHVFGSSHSSATGNPVSSQRFENPSIF
ncbi:hypothetical protein EDB85DRAFT_1901441 [Lactarius pseudohatsudake]|nr:hypothetical protein EDB85DRAFT_1901441 [Lactarius pseudohatsudake]